jgi:lipoate-protein ligase A
MNNSAVTKALNQAGVNAVTKRTCVKASDKTLVVSAQARNSDAVLHHGTIMGYVNMPLFSNILGATERERELLKQITWMSDFGDVPRISRTLQENMIMNLAGADYKPEGLSPVEMELARRLHSEIYGNAEHVASGTKERGVCVIIKII